MTAVGIRLEWQARLSSRTAGHHPLTILPRADRQADRCNTPHRIENMFGRLKDCRRIAMRYDRCAHTFMSAICLAAVVLFWINES